MPTVLKESGYRFFFYAGDRGEPPHVHVEQEDRVAKFWLIPVRLAASGGFRRHEINEIQALVVEKQQTFVEAWNEFFGN